MEWLVTSNHRFNLHCFFRSCLSILLCNISADPVSYVQSFFRVASKPATSQPPHFAQPLSPGWTYRFRLSIAESIPNGSSHAFWNIT